MAVTMTQGRYGGMWNESPEEATTPARGLLEALYNSGATEREQARRGLDALYARRGLRGSGMAAQAQAYQDRQFDEARQGQAFNLAQFYQQIREAVNARNFNSYTQEKDANIGIETQRAAQPSGLGQVLGTAAAMYMGGNPYSAAMGTSSVGGGLSGMGNAMQRQRTNAPVNNLGTFFSQPQNTSTGFGGGMQGFGGQFNWTNPVSNANRFNYGYDIGRNTNPTNLINFFDPMG